MPLLRFKGWLSHRSTTGPWLALGLTVLGAVRGCVHSPPGDQICAAEKAQKSRLDPTLCCCGHSALDGVRLTAGPAGGHTGLTVRMVPG